MPKNIILLSDGTGNSSGKLLKTNVWRVYESLDLTDPSVQVACYDDGVGTSAFKPLALLGGAFGVGLKRNVLRLYRFLCEHYDPGDRIYAFGFSRGAFTIRVLIGLVCNQGIIRTRPTSPLAAAYGKPTSPGTEPLEYDLRNTVVLAEPQVFGRELARLARWAYREFRAEQFKQAGILVNLARGLRDVACRLREGRAYRERPYEPTNNHHVPEIAFLGLWDTVDAYGLPVDELTDGINNWVWPLFAPDFTLSDKVKKACHVLAIDDERNTFHPVLWDESEEQQNATHLDDERISQVWFAGMHANVGGGYPDDALSYVSLEWITTEAKKQELKFVKELLEHHTRKADVFGRVYDSRSGLKSYYRYNPRRIEWLTNGQVHEAGFGGRPKPQPTVTVARPKIHESVFARIAAAPEAYAPIIFPKHYGIVRENGSIVNGLDNLYESTDARALRFEAQESAWNLVWWRRVLYFATVAVSLFAVILPIGSIQPEITPAERTIVSQALSVVADTLPSFASSWVAYYSAHPTQFSLLLGAILVLWWFGAKTQLAIRDCMRNIWSQVIPPPGRDLHNLKAPSGFLYRMRSHPYYQGAFAVLRHKVLPTVFGIGTLIILALGALGVGNRAAFEGASTAGALCAPAPQAALTQIWVGATTEVALNSGDFCNATPLFLEQGGRYGLTIALPPDWKDDTTQVASVAGFHALSPGLTPRQRTVFALFAPFRRMWSTNWFVPVGRIGSSGLDQYPFAEADNEFTARKTGELFLFVNDAIAPLGPFGVDWRQYYANNAGTATVTIKRLR